MKIIHDEDELLIYETATTEGLFVMDVADIRSGEEILISVGDDYEPSIYEVNGKKYVKLKWKEDYDLPKIKDFANGE